MNTATACAAALLAVATLPLMAQQAGAPQAQSPAVTTQQSTAAAATADMRPVAGELQEKLDSKTAQAGDSVVLKTQSNAKMASGVDIPKGSKLVGKIVAVKPSGQGNANAQVALQFDHIELRNGQTVPVRSELESVAPSNANVMPDNGMPSASSAPMAAAPAPGGGAPGQNPSGANSPAPAQPSMASPESAQSAAPTPGTVVARNGGIAISTTSIPGVLLARNDAGQQDPRMGQSSGILLGARQNIHLDGGTRIVVNVAPVAAATGGGQ